jgi:hypothetical protein
MGLYDEGDYEAPEETSSTESNAVGKVIANVNKKPLKDKASKKIPSDSSSFGLPDWIRPLAIGLVSIILILVLGFLIYLAVQPNYLSVNLKPNPSLLIDGSSTTKLSVEVKNILDYDLKNLELSITPTDKLSVVVLPSDVKKISILGADETRQFNYDISSIGNISPGEYKITITLKTSEEVVEKQVTWKVQNRK